MSPGINNPRNTGTLPKSNRRNDRNRERSAANQIANRSAGHSRAQQTNNLFSLDWKPTIDREAPRVAKNSNTRSVSSAPSTSYQDISEFASSNCGRHYNYSSEELAYWQKMVPPADSRTQSPPRVQDTKPSNVDRMPDRGQVESRLSQIREYIRVTSGIMDQLSQSGDPCAQAQHEKLGKMVEDLYDSDKKLSRLLELYQNRGIFDQNGENIGDETDANADDASREVQLRKKMEESQRKIAQLQEHQANLVGMQLRLRDQLTEARQAQQVLLQHDNPKTPSLPLPLPAKVEELENETAALRGKLAQLQSKKKHMDHFVAELQAIELSDRASSSSDGSRNFVRDKTAELEAMKAQVAHLKALMEEATRARECGDNTSDPDADADITEQAGVRAAATDEENRGHMSFERQSDSDETSQEKLTNTDDRPTVEKIQAVTREMREQAALLQSTRAELQKLKQPGSSSQWNSSSPSTYPSFTPPPSLAASTNSENKQSNRASVDSQPLQEKRRQIEDFMRKESSQASSVNCDIAGPDVNSQRSSSSHISQSSTPATAWPTPAVIGLGRERNADTITSAENLLDAGALQPPAIENGFHGNWLAYPVPAMNQLQHGSAEYYRQLLLGSQAQQLQMMGVTLQQCCQLLTSQQREIQSLRSAISQLQAQIRQNQSVQRVPNEATPEDYSNLSRISHHLAESLDGALPPSSSLPNLVSLPNSSPAMSHTVTGASSNSAQHYPQQQQQLNNQVPPGNRANNYWDNFRSYSRQNLLSASVKTMAESSTGATGNAVPLTNAHGNGLNSSAMSMKDKRNRDQGSDHMHLPSLAAAAAAAAEGGQYSLNLQCQSNLQQHERDNIVTRSNIFASDVSQQQGDNLWEVASTSYSLPSAPNDDHPLHNLSSEMKEVLSSLLLVNKKRPDYLIIILREIKAISEDQRLLLRLLRSLRALQDTQSPNNPLNEATDQTASESCQSSDDDSEIGAALGISQDNHQSSMAELITIPEAGGSSSPTAQAALIDHYELPVRTGTPLDECAKVPPPSTSIIKPSCNEDLAEADQSRHESTDSHQDPNTDCKNTESQEDGIVTSGASMQTASDVDIDLKCLATRAEDERVEDRKSEKVNFTFCHALCTEGYCFFVKSPR